MAGLVPAIHVFGPTIKSWMPGMKPGMTETLCESSLSESAPMYRNAPHHGLLKLIREQ
jgi:hypothetical protein